MPETEEDKKRKPKFAPTGRSGTLVTSFTIQDEYLSELVGTDGQIQYTKMLRSDSKVKQSYNAIANPIRSAEWFIDPVGEEQQDLDVAAVIDKALFSNLPEGWIGKLDEILTFPWNGHAVFEPIHKNYVDALLGPYTGLLNLAFREQSTLTEWKYSREGILEFIHQSQSGDIPIEIDIPADELVIFFNEKKGSDSGYPFCRMIYGNYKRKLLYKELQAIGMEKAAIPTPRLTVPASVEFDSEEYKDAVKQLEEYTSGERAFFILPNGYELEYNQQSSFDPSKSQIAIKAENEEISGSILAMFLEFGLGGNSGNQAGTTIAAKTFTNGIKYIANKIADKINCEVIPHLVRLNFGDTVKVMPKLKHSGITDEDGLELMEILTGYVDKGVITPDERLEDHVRKIHNFPAKVEGEQIDNKESKDKDGETNEPEPTPEDEEELELSDKGKPRTARALINHQAPIVSDDIKRTLTFASTKYINDVMAKYKQLPDSKKGNATNKVKMAGVSQLRKDLKRSLTETVFLSIEMAKKEVPVSGTVKLNSNEGDLNRMKEWFGDIRDIKLNEFSSLPAHIQVLIQKQSDLISQNSLDEIKKTIDFGFSGNLSKTADENIIRQVMQDNADDFISSNQVATKGTNNSALMVNEGRNTYFFNDDVLDEIHSFTFINASPKSDVCIELAGTTFKTNDAGSLRYSPPLHHNCKSYLRANLKTSRGVDNLDVTTLAPSAKAIKSISL